MRKNLVLFSLLILIFLAGCVYAPYATDAPGAADELEENKDYELYDSDVWIETYNSVNESESHFLDLGTRTQDGSMHIYLQSQAPDTTYEMNISNIELVEEDTEKGIIINASVEETNDDIGATVITDVHQHIQMTEYVQMDLDYVQVKITDGWGKTETLERDACGCVLEKDPKSN